MYIEIDGESRKSYADNLLEKMLVDEPRERMTSTEVVTQLESVMKNESLSSSVQLEDNIKAIIRPRIDVHAEQKTIVNPEKALKYMQGFEIQLERRAELEMEAFSSVFRGEFKSRPVAGKRIAIYHDNIIEKEAMLTLDHPNVVKLCIVKVMTTSGTLHWNCATLH